MSLAAPAGRPRGRSATAGVIGAVAVVAILLATVAGTVHAVVLSPDTLTTVVAPVGENPQVRAAVADAAAAQVVTDLDIEARAEHLIGDPVGALAAPAIARAVQHRLASAIDDALASPAFEAHWQQMVHATVTSAVSVLRGDSALVATSGGVIYLNVLPAIAGTLDVLRAQGLIEASVQLPDLSNPSTPARQAIALLSSALGLSLPADFGQVAIAETSALEMAQGVVAVLDAVTVLLILGAVALTAAAVVLAAERPAMVIRIGIGAALAVAVMPLLLRLADSTISSSLASPGMSVVAAAFIDAIVEAVSWPLRVVAGVCLGVAVATMLATALGGRADRRAAALAPLLAGAAALLAAWAGLGPDIPVLAFALVIGGVWVGGRVLLAPAHV